MKKKFLAGLLALVMIVTMLPVSALAAGMDRDHGHGGWDDWFDGWFDDFFDDLFPGKDPECKPQTYDVYYYTLIPGKDMNSVEDPDTVWNGMGVGSISGVAGPEEYDVGTTIPDGTHTEPASFPSLTVDGETYTYTANATPGPKEYTITWVRTVVSRGANRGANGVNPVVPQTTKTFHRDGVVTLGTEPVDPPKPDPVTANYTVKHYLQNLDGASYTLDADATETKSGEVGAQTAASAKTYTGFTAQTVTQATITADGSTVVEIYYDRNTYTVTWVDWNDTVLETDVNVKYGATPSFDGETPTRSSDGKYTYTFKGWDPDPASTEVTGNLTIKAQYEAVEIPDVPVDPEVKAVTVVKTVADLDGNPVTKASAGDVLVYTVEVKNTGNVDLAGVKIADTLENASGSIYFVPTDNVTYADGVFTIATLAEGATETVTYYYLVRMDDAGKTLKNTAASTLAEKASVVEIPVAPLADPGYTVVKTVKEAYAWVGDTIHYTITVKNTSKETIRNLWVVDEMLGLRKHITELKAGEVWERTYEYEVRRADAGEKLRNHVVVYANGAAVEADSGITWVNSKLPALNTTDHVSYIIGYDDGTVRPTGTITRAETATIFFRLMTDETRAWYWSKTNTFTDVPEDAWYNNAVSTLQAAGVIVDSKYTFRPSDAITRAEFAVMAAQFTGLTTNKASSFTDVSKSHWAADEIALVEQMGWIEGYPDGTFRPDETISRAEAMAIVNRMLERAVEEGHMLPNMVTWKDCSSSAWYYEDVQEATNSHEFVRLAKKVPGETYCYEEWVKLLKNPDWAALEKTWSQANSK